MSRLSRAGDEILLDHVRTALLAGLGNVTAPSAITGAAGACTITSSSNNPSYTHVGAVTIANGGSVTAAENLRSVTELNYKAAAMNADATAVRTAVVSLIASGVRGNLTLAAPTVVAASATNKLIGVTYTASDPSITPNNAITVANGGSVTAAELHEMVVELNKEGYLLWQDLSRLHYAAKTLIESRDFRAITALAAMVSNAAMAAITYTTGNPSITPDAASTVSNGSSPTAAEIWHTLVEVKDQLQKCRADVLTTYTALSTFLTKAGL